MKCQVTKATSQLREYTYIMEEEATGWSARLITPSTQMDVRLKKKCFILGNKK